MILVLRAVRFNYRSCLRYNTEFYNAILKAARIASYKSATRIQGGSKSKLLILNKYVNKTECRQLRKHSVIKVCSREYLTIEIQLALDPNFQVLDRSQNYRIFNVRTIV